jgi:hypothetical protein
MGRSASVMMQEHDSQVSSKRERGGGLRFSLSVPGGEEGEGDLLQVSRVEGGERVMRGW